MCVCVCSCVRMCVRVQSLFYNVHFPAFQCYCNSYYSSSCTDQEIITCPGEGGACEISIQSDSDFGNYTYQGCVENSFLILLCNDELSENPGSIVPYSYCCKQELCNSEEELQRLIAGGELPSTDTSSSYHCEAVVPFLKFQSCIPFVCSQMKLVRVVTNLLGPAEV